MDCSDFLLPFMFQKLDHFQVFLYLSLQMSQFQYFYQKVIINPLSPRYQISRSGHYLTQYC